MTDHDQGANAGTAGSVPLRDFPQQQFGGTFTYRFSGFTMLDRVMYRLAGLGRFQIDATGHVTGTQRSSITALQGQGAKLLTGNFKVEGRIAMQNDGTGSATLTFTKTSGSGRGVKGEFNVIVAGSADRFWLVSAGGVVLDDKGKPTDEHADELVDVEAIRIAA
jgi:hypothetical protein